MKTLTLRNSKNITPISGEFIEERINRGRFLVKSDKKVKPAARPGYVYYAAPRAVNIGNNRYVVGGNNPIQDPDVVAELRQQFEALDREEAIVAMAQPNVLIGRI